MHCVTVNNTRESFKTSHQDKTKLVMASAGGYRNIQIGREEWDPRQRYVYTTSLQYIT